MMSFVTIYYKTKDLQTIQKIQERFGFPKRMTVNGECAVILDGKDWEVLKKRIKIARLAEENISAL